MKQEENLQYGRVSRRAHRGSSHPRPVKLTPEELAALLAPTPAKPRPMTLVGHRPPSARRPRGELVLPRRVPVDDVRWSVVRTVHGWERYVAEDLHEIGIRGYCPLRLDVTITSDKYKGGKARRTAKQLPLFSRYIFVGAPAGVVLSRFLHDKIESIVSDASGPLCVPSRVVQGINDLELAGEWGDPRKWREVPVLAKGTQVRIVTGSFAGFEGVVAKLPRDLRVELEIKLFGRPTPLEIDACDLEPSQAMRVAVG